jgi:hypothetical protein
MIESPNGLIQMNRETYRNSDYYREPKTSNRIAVSTLKRKAQNCMILITALLLFFTCNMKAQSKWWQLDKRDIWASSAMFLAGWADGTAELTKWHYDAFEGFYGDVNDDWYNPHVSWRNKYENGDASLGPAYFGSTTFLVGTTDNYHMMRSVRNVSISATLLIMPKCEWDWKRMLFRIFVYSVANRAGFWLGYELPLRLNR